MNAAKAPQPISNGTGWARRFLSHLVAFVLTALVATAFTYFVQSRSIFPPNAIIIQTHGYNDKALEALRNSGIPTFTLVDTTGLHCAFAFASVLWTTRFLAVVLVVYFCLLALARRFLQ